MTVLVKVMLKPGVLDPQGITVKDNAQIWTGTIK